MAHDDSPFLSRWSQRKARARGGLPVEPAARARTVAAPAPTPKPLEDAPVPGSSLAASAASADADVATDTAGTAQAPLPTLEDVSALTRESDYSGFVARGVGPEVRNAALKKLFTDPHFNVMDGLDTYIEDFGVPDPLPPGMLRKMVQSQLLGLFADERGAAAETTNPIEPRPSAPAASAAEPPALPTPNDEDADLQLQPDDAPGRPGPEPGPGQDPGREH